jgi:hypothetical protein
MAGPSAREEQQDLFALLDQMCAPEPAPPVATRATSRSKRPRSPQPAEFKLPVTLSDSGLSAEELAEELEEEDDKENDEQSKLSPSENLEALLRGLRQKWLTKTQNDFGFPLPRGTLRFRTDNQLYRMQDELIEGCTHLLRDTRTKNPRWLELILWLVARPMRPELCSPLSFQSCCGAVRMDFDGTRELILQWIAKDQVTAGPGDPGSFQAECVRRNLDPQQLRERILRHFAPSLL